MIPRYVFFNAGEFFLAWIAYNAKKRNVSSKETRLEIIDLHKDARGNILLVSVLWGKLGEEPPGLAKSMRCNIPH